MTFQLSQGGVSQKIYEKNSELIEIESSDCATESRIGKENVAEMTR